jgi:hypothetical protein
MPGYRCLSTSPNHDKLWVHDARKSTIVHIVKKLLGLYKIAMFISMYTTVCCLSLSWASWIQSTPCYSGSFKILSPSTRSAKQPPSFWLSKQISVIALLFFPLRATCPTNVILLHSVILLISVTNLQLTLVRTFRSTILNLLIVAPKIPFKCSVVDIYSKCQ